MTDCKFAVYCTDNYSGAKDAENSGALYEIENIGHGISKHNDIKAIAETVADCLIGDKNSVVVAIKLNNNTEWSQLI